MTAGCEEVFPRSEDLDTGSGSLPGSFNATGETVLLPRHLDVGLTTRPWGQTLADTLAWEMSRRAYDSEAPVLARLHDGYLPKHGPTFNSKHHEVYLSDARRTDPEKLRTTFRQPVAALS